MGRMYTVPIAFTSKTGAFDLAEIVVPADAVMILHEVRITQKTEIGDAQSEMFQFSIKRASGSYTSGSGGSTPTPVKHSFGDAAAGITAETNNTTQAVAGSGALETIQQLAEHVANGWQHLPTPEARLVFSPAQACVISLDAAPADSSDIGGFVVVEEIGG